MKILIIGGCGQQVQPAIHYLLNSSTFEELIIGDINIDAAHQLIEELQSTKASVCHLDILDRTNLVAAIENVDIVLNASGPYHMLGLKVLEATIEAGKHYVDYCDDVEPTLDMLALSERASTRGITAIVGLGASPGYTNLLAMHAANQLDSVDEVNMYWNIAKGEPEGPAVLDHMYHIMDGDVIQYLEGQRQRVPALSGMGDVIKIPTADTLLPSVYVGHPEPATLPDYIPGVTQVICKYADTADELSFYQGLKTMGLFDKNPLDVKGSKVSPRDLLINRVMAMPHEEVPADKRVSSAVIDVKGKRNGKSTTIRCSASANMAPLTSIPAALGAEMLARGAITKTGVYPPEGCIDPSSIIEPLVKMSLVTQDISIT